MSEIKTTATITVLISKNGQTAQEVPLPIGTNTVDVEKIEKQVKKLDAMFAVIGSPYSFKVVEDIPIGRDTFKLEV